MADTRANDAEEQTQQSAMPTEEQKLPESPAGVAGQETRETGETSPDGETTKDAKLPEDSSERTKQQFEKLKAQLRDARERLAKSESVFESIKPKQQPQGMPTADQYIDPETGIVDIAGLNRAIATAEKRAARAESTVQSYIEQQQTKEALKSYPQLDPKADNFDKDFHQRTRAFLMDSMVNPQDYGGKVLSFKEAADRANVGNTKVVEAAKQKGAEEAVTSLTPKEQASLEATGRSDRRQEGRSLEDLSRETRKGGTAGLKAAYERLQGIPLKS